MSHDVFEEFRKNELAGFYMLHGDFIWSRSLESLWATIFGRKAPNFATETLAVIVHELSHAIVLRGSVTGLLLSRLDDAQADAVRLIRKEMSNEPNLRSILNPYIGFFLSNPDNIDKESILIPLSAWLSAEFLKYAFDHPIDLKTSLMLNNLCHFMVAVDPAATASYYQDQAQFASFDVALNQLEASLKSNPDALLPKTGFGTIALIDLVEGIARAVEYHTCITNQELNPYLKEHLERIQFKKQPLNEYTRAFAYFLGERIPSCSLDRIDSLPDSMKLKLLAIFVGLADLALNGPWPVIGLESTFASSALGERSHGWSDLHPGWRFVKAVKAMLPNSYEVIERIHDSPANEDSTQESIQTITNEICTTLGWPTPKSLKKRILERLRDVCVPLTSREQWVQFYLDDLRGYDIRGKRFIEAAEIEYEYGTNFLFPTTYLPISKRNLLTFFPRIMVGNAPMPAQYFGVLIPGFMDSEIMDPNSAEVGSALAYMSEDRRILRIRTARHLMLSNEKLLLAPLYEEAKIGILSLINQLKDKRTAISDQMSSWENSVSEQKLYLKLCFHLTDEFFNQV